MGSFNATCIVSGLPIEAGTPVRFLALARNRFHPKGNDHVCYVDGRWQVYGVPLKAPYNDYGRVDVEDLEESFTTSMFFEGLKRGAVEKGVGDNQCHDVAVNADLDREGWLEALWEGRVEVLDRVLSPLAELEGLQKALGSPLRESEEKDPVGLPTLRRIEKVLTDAGKSVTTSYGASGYVLDEVSSGFIRVRHGDFATRDQAVAEAVPIIRAAGYAAMVTAGTGSYAAPSEVLVAPLPPTDPSVHIFSRGLAQEEDYNAPRPVSLAMIREDVWEILRTMSTGHAFDSESFRKAALEAVTEELESKVKFDRMTQDEKVLQLSRSLLGDSQNLFLNFLGGHGYTLGAAYRLACKIAPDPESLKKYVLDLADMIYVQFAYSALHGQWHPTTNSSQDGNWNEHREFLLKLAEIRGRYEDEDEDEGSDDSIEE